MFVTCSDPPAWKPKTKYFASIDLQIKAVNGEHTAVAPKITEIFCESHRLYIDIVSFYNHDVFLCIYIAVAGSGRTALADGVLEDAGGESIGAASWCPSSSPKRTSRALLKTMTIELTRCNAAAIIVETHPNETKIIPIIMKITPKVKF